MMIVHNKVKKKVLRGGSGSRRRRRLEKAMKELKAPEGVQTRAESVDDEPGRGECVWAPEEGESGEGCGDGEDAEEDGEDEGLPDGAVELLHGQTGPRDLIVHVIDRHLLAAAARPPLLSLLLLLLLLSLLLLALLT